MSAWYTVASELAFWLNYSCFLVVFYNRKKVVFIKQLLTAEEYILYGIIK